MGRVINGAALDQGGACDDKEDMGKAISYFCLFLYFLITV